MDITLPMREHLTLREAVSIGKNEEEIFNIFWLFVFRQFVLLHFIF
jgi:hypothetical protein